MPDRDQKAAHAAWKRAQATVRNARAAQQARKSNILRIDHELRNRRQARPAEKRAVKAAVDTDDGKEQDAEMEGPKDQSKPDLATLRKKHATLMARKTVLAAELAPLQARVATLHKAWEGCWLSTG